MLRSGLQPGFQWLNVWETQARSCQVPEELGLNVKAMPVLWYTVVHVPVVPSRAWTRWIIGAFSAAVPTTIVVVPPGSTTTVVSVFIGTLTLPRSEALFVSWYR